MAGQKNKEKREDKRMIRLFQIDNGIAIMKWDDLRDMKLIAEIAIEHSKDIEVKSIDKESYS